MINNDLPPGATDDTVPAPVHRGTGVDPAVNVMHAHIDYGSGYADLWGRFNAETVERAFYHHANQCFGIRKSIMRFELLSIEPSGMPAPWSLLPEADVMLKHTGGDTIVWNAAGDKIKSEWD